MISRKLPAARSRGFFAGHRPRVIAHRGAAGSTPENTLVSFRQAIAEGADILEFDVRATSDGQPVVIHDAALDRTTSGSGPLKDRSLSQIKALDAGYRFTADGGKTFPFRGKGIEIPTLAEVLDQFPETPLVVEIKEDDIFLVQRVMAQLEQHGRFARADVLITADNHLLMKAIRKAAPSGLTGHSRRELWQLVAASWLSLPFLFRGHGDAIQLLFARGRLRLVTKRVLRLAHKHGFEVYAWTVNNQPEMRRLIKLGVDGLFTDFPGRMREIVDSSK